MHGARALRRNMDPGRAGAATDLREVDETLVRLIPRLLTELRVTGDPLDPLHEARVAALEAVTCLLGVDGPESAGMPDAHRADLLRTALASARASVSRPGRRGLPIRRFRAPPAASGRVGPWRGRHSFPINTSHQAIMNGPSYRPNKRPRNPPRNLRPSDRCHGVRRKGRPSRCGARSVAGRCQALREGDRGVRTAEPQGPADRCAGALGDELRAGRQLLVREGRRPHRRPREGVQAATCRTGRSAGRAAIRPAADHPQDRPGWRTRLTG